MRRESVVRIYGIVWILCWLGSIWFDKIAWKLLLTGSLALVISIANQSLLNEDKEKGN